MVKVHESRFTLLSGSDKLSEYQFHTHTARHFFCSVCGIYTFHRKRSAPDCYGINVFCLQGEEMARILAATPRRMTDGLGMP